MLNVLLQTQHTAQMANAADTDKYMVVVAVVTVIFTGIVGYLIYIDRKLKKLEGK